MRRFSGRLVIAALAVGGGYAAARTLAPALQSGGAPAGASTAAVAGGSSAERPATASAADTSGDGDRLLSTVLATLENRPNVAAGVRQFVRLGAERLSAEGRYWQQSLGNGRRTRWDLATKVDDSTAYIAQVFDGDVVWTDRKHAGTRKVTRVDVGRIGRELAALGGGAGEGGRLEPELLARGGLTQLAAELSRCFTFASPHTMRRGDRVVLAVVGQWRPEPLARHWPAAAGGDWPAHLPHHVLLHIDNDDYFPYYIEYRSGDQRDEAATATAHFPVREPLCSIEFIDVQFAAAMDERLFQFSPGDGDFQDATSRVLEQLRPPAPAAPPTARRPALWR